MLKEKKKIEVNWDYVIIGFLAALVVTPIIVASILIGWDLHDELSSKMTLRHCDHYYYVNSYTEVGDYITAIDIKGRKVILPKNDTIIECRGE